MRSLSSRPFARVAVLPLLAWTACSADPGPVTPPSPSATSTAAATASATAASATATVAPADPGSTVPPVPASVRAATQIEDVEDALWPAMLALLENARKRCPSSQAMAGWRDRRSPAAGTPLESDPGVLEVSADCHVVHTEDREHASFSIATFEPLHGAPPDRSAPQTIHLKRSRPSPGADLGVTWGLQCPSGRSHQDGAVDVLVKLPIAAGSRSYVTVGLSIVAPGVDCVSSFERREMAEGRARASKILAPLLPGIDAALKTAEALCAAGPAAFRQEPPSPARGTALESDRRVLDVVTTCFFGDSDGSPSADTAKLHSSAETTGSFSALGSVRRPRELIAVEQPVGNPRDVTLISVERTTSTGKMWLWVYARTSALPPGR